MHVLQLSLSDPDRQLSKADLQRLPLGICLWLCLEGNYRMANLVKVDSSYFVVKINGDTHLHLKYSDWTKKKEPELRWQEVGF